jgi:hypothetical protein
VVVFCKSTTTTTTKEFIVAENQTNLWDDADEIEGLDLVDKATLVGVPFLVTGIHFTVNNDNVSYVWLDAINRAGEPFTFNDSSSGVRAQVIEYLGKIGKSDAVETEEIVSVKLKVGKGLRVSEYDREVPDARSGKMVWKRLRTYYLTTSGKRETPAPKAAAAAARKASPGKAA